MTNGAGRRELRLSAYAKVNLALEVLGRRTDGFHEVVSVTQTISLHDTLTASASTDFRVTTEPPVVADADNLVRRAAEALFARLGRPPTGSVHIDKRIPLAAGLGGGSSDAASALRLLDRLWQSAVGPGCLPAIAARLGSDVPLFLTGGTALLSGRGEQVTSLPSPPTFWLALACPSFDVPEKTRRLYAALHPSEWSDGRATSRLAHRIRAGGSVLDAELVNAFDGPAARVYPVFSEMRSRLADAAGAVLHLTGAGPSLFALFETRAEAQQAARRMSRFGVQTFVARSIARSPGVTLAPSP